RNKRWRSYSIASMPDGSNVIELVVVKLEGGLGSGYLFDNTDVGSELILRGPQGVFVLPEEMPHDLFMICTGTGIAPLRSMLHYSKTDNIAHSKLNPIFGTGRTEDLLYHDEVRELEEQIANFRYFAVLSRDVWDNDPGYVHAVYE